MSSTGNGHLTDKQLLLYADGELAAKESTRCRAHLEACWTCRARLDDLQDTIKEIVNFRNHVLLPMVPPPTRHWDGLDPRMQELDAGVKKHSVAERLSDLFRSVTLSPRYAIFAILVLGTLGALIWLPSQPTISANELLARVQAAQSAELGKDAAPILHQRLRVRRKVAGSSEQTTTDYDAWEDKSRGRFHQSGSSAEVLAELRAICDSNRLDWRAPLSAAGYVRWRDSLTTKQDFVAPHNVSTPRDMNYGPEPLALTTVAGPRDGDGSPTEKSQGNRIVKAELVVRTADWHPVEERLWVNDREYEIAELDYRVLPFAEVDASIFAEPAAPVKPVEGPRPVVREMGESLVPPPPDPNETEMAVRYELHRLDADLGEPIEISRDIQGKVVVEASGVAPDLQAKLKQQLAFIPNTGLDLAETGKSRCEGCPAPPPETPDAASKAPAPTTLSVVPEVNPNDKRLEEIFGDPHAQESFTREVLAASSDALSRGFALRDLAVRYPPEEEAKLAPQSKAQLKEMVDDHIAALAEPTNLLQGLLRPLLEALSNRDTAGAGSPDGSALEAPHDEVGKAVGAGLDGALTDGSPLPIPQWQNASLEIFAAVQKADRMIKGLLTSTNAAIPADQVVPELRRALSEQQQALNQYLRRGQ